MNVKFENAEVHISKLVQGCVVKYYNDYYHLQSFSTTRDGRFLIHIQNYWENHELSPQFVTWVN